MGENLSDLRESFLDLSWTPKMAVVKTIYWPKKRLISAPRPFDRVAFHAIVDVVEPYFEQKFIFHSYASRVDKGTHNAVLAAQGMLRSMNDHPNAYVFKGDIHHYFASIDHEILKGIVRKTIKDNHVLLILDRIIDGPDYRVVIKDIIRRLVKDVSILARFDSFIDEDVDHSSLKPWFRKLSKQKVMLANLDFCVDSIDRSDERSQLKKAIRNHLKDPDLLSRFDKHVDAHESHQRLKKWFTTLRVSRRELLYLTRLVDIIDYKVSVGLPLGALTSNKLFANAYMDVFDHYIKEELHVKNYIRYMDDFLIIVENKAALKDIVNNVETFLDERLHLNINPKSGIFPARHGIDFCGYRIFPGYIKPRKRNLKTARHRLWKLHNDVKSGKVSMDKFKASLYSYLGYVKHCDGYRSMESILDNIKF